MTRRTANGSSKAPGRRNVKLVRQWRLLSMLRQQPRTLQELASGLKVSDRTVRRDLEALQEVHVPIVRVVTEDDESLGQWGLMRGAPCPCCGV